MNENIIEPNETARGESSPPLYNKDESIFFNGKSINEKYYEITNNKKAKIIFADRNALAKKEPDDKTIINNFNDYEEITFICDFNNLSETLELNILEKIITKFIEKKIKLDCNTQFSLIIQNCLLAEKENEEIKPLFKDLPKDNLKFKKLEISDELYSFSPYVKTIFFNFKVEELVLKKFKFNSKSQLNDFCNLIYNTRCKKLTLDDFFIELIIKRNENDDEYNDLDIYFNIADNGIILNHTLTEIKSLTLRDTPLFAIIGGDLFSNKSDNITVDVDQNSLLNPSIITKFKIEDGKYDICFDLDSYKIKLEEELGEEEQKKYDYIDFLKYIFNILSPNSEKKKQANDKKDVSDSGTENIDATKFHKLVFKNFDITKYEYITGEDVTYIDEKNWVLNKEEQKRKLDFEEFEKKLREANHVNTSQLNEIVFDNCSNLFIRLALEFLKGRNQILSSNYSFDLLKLKKCSKDYVDISRILKMKIKNLILFDTPLIIGPEFPEPGRKHFEFIEKDGGRFGSFDNFTIKLNSLDCYAREYNLNIMKTYEILIEIMEKENYNKNLIFELNALPNIMMYLCYIKYVKNQNKYNNPNDDEDGKDEIEGDLPRAEGAQNIFEEDVNYLPKYIFLSAKKYRDLLCSDSFKLNWKLTTPITLKNTTIKKCLENYENQNYIILKKQQENNKNNNNANKMYTTNKELRKMDFGSDGFNIERDYKYFFYENNIEEVILDNVSFSNYRDSSIEGKSREFETINNLIGNNLYGGSLKIYDNMNYPKYTMDMRTFNGIFCINYGFDNVLGFFRYLIYEKFDKPDDIETIYANTKCMSQTFSRFKSNNIVLTIIIKSIEEQKEFYCLATIIDFIITKGVMNEKRVKAKENVRYLEEKIENYFNKEKNENDELKYSDFNYYYTSEDEEKMAKEGIIKIGDLIVKISKKY